MSDRTNCIYAIRNIQNNKRYIGSTINVKKRWSEHQRTLRNGTHHARHLQRAWKKYGEDAFVFELLETDIVYEDLLKKEQTWLNQHHTRELYNTTPYVRNGFHGYHHTAETKQKISQLHTGRTRSLLTCIRISDGTRGVPKRPSKRAPCSDATKDRLRQYCGEKSSFYGRKHTEATKQKQRDAHLGKPRNLETRRKMASGRKTKLTWAIVDQIRTRFAPVRTMATHYSVSVMTIYLVLQEKRWHPSLRPNPVLE